MNGFTRVAAGHYRHTETGIEIRRQAAYREHGCAVGVRWKITVPMVDGVHTYGSARTLRDATDWAVTGEDSFVERRRAAIAIAWDDAHAENGEQITIVDRFMIEAAHSAAFAEDNYRCLLVYGMGRR